MTDHYDEMTGDLASFRAADFSLPVPEGAAFGWYHGDFEKMRQAVAQVDDSWPQYFHEDQPCEVYGHAFHKGFAFAFRCKATFDVNPADYGVSVRLYDAYMGELAIPEQMLDLMLQRILEGSEHVHYSGSRSANVLFTAEYTIEIPHTDGLTIGVKEAYSKDGALVCRTNSLTGEALRTAKEYLQSKEGWDSVTDAVDDVKDRIKDKIHNWLSDEDE